MPTTSSIRRTSTLLLVLLIISLTLIRAEDAAFSDVLESHGLDKEKHFNSAHRARVAVNPAQLSVCRDGTYCVEPWWAQDFELQDFIDSHNQTDAEEVRESESGRVLELSLIPVVLVHVSQSVSSSISFCPASFPFSFGFHRDLHVDQVVCHAQ